MAAVVVVMFAAITFAVIQGKSAVTELVVILTIAVRRMTAVLEVNNAVMVTALQHVFILSMMSIPQETNVNVVGQLKFAGAIKQTTKYQKQFQVGQDNVRKSNKI